MPFYRKLHKHLADLNKKNGIGFIYNEIIEGAYRYKGIILNLKKGTLQYNNNKIYEISPDSKPIKLLERLMDKAGEIAKYEDIADELDINSKNNAGYLVIAIKDIKKQLVKILENVGVDRKKIATFIISKKNQGYKLR